MAFENLPLSIDPATRKPAPERFATAGDVRDFCTTLLRGDFVRSSDRQKVQGMIDGNRPVPQSVMAAQQQGWRANVNYRIAEGQIQAMRTPYYDLATENDPCLDVHIEYGTSRQQRDWEQIIAKHAHWLIHDWEFYNWHTQLQQSEMCVHGWGSHVWLGGLDWRPTTWPMRHVLFPDETTSCLDDSLECFMIREKVKAHQLYRLIQNAGAARKAGWNVENTTDAIILARKDGRNRQRTAEDFQQLVKNNDLGYSYNKAREIWLNHVFVREFDNADGPGKISHYIIEERGVEYLYVKRNQFKDWSNIITLFPYDIGSDGTLHSIRGLGARIFSFCELFNRLNNTMVDSVLVGSSPMMLNKGATDLTALQLTSLGPMKILPQGIEPASYKIMDLQQGPLALSKSLQEQQDENNKTYRQTAAQSNVERTAREIDANAQDSTKLEKSSHNLYYVNLDRFYKETLRRAANTNLRDGMPGAERAMDFQDRCLRDGVPKEALMKIKGVHATRAMGAGSVSQRIAVTRELMTTIYPGADEPSRINMRRDYVAALAGRSNVDRYAPPVDMNQIADNDDAMAVLENDALISGGDAIVTSDQNHFKHVGRHMMKADQLLQTLQSGQGPQAQAAGNPQQVLSAWMALGPHIAAHMAYLERDPTRKAQFDQLHQNFVTLSKMADKLNQHVAEMRKEQEAQAQLQQQQQDAATPQGSTGPFGDPELDMKWQKMTGEMQIKAQRAMAEMQLKQQKQQAETAMADAGTAADIRRKNLSGGNGAS